VCACVCVLLSPFSLSLSCSSGHSQDEQAHLQTGDLDDFGQILDEFLVFKDRNFVIEDFEDKNPYSVPDSLRDKDWCVEEHSGYNHRA